ncbi:FHA domain-containing protein [Kribbella pratensis]|uniref:FHA domain-containing protein n=1 Tax=Kribbella pratensis TaxID=2512112 RepID=A0A4R8C3K4_9ACTN|nr:FHA domain-containing protein [Kribbella pratensis]
MLSLGEQRWTLPAEADTITIGRASNADIRLQADDQISRIHARLARDGATWTLHDESRNGTGLNGHRITAPTALSTGDRIHIGRSVLTFHKSTIPDPVTPTAAHPGEAYAAGAQPDAYPRADEREAASQPGEAYAAGAQPDVYPRADEREGPSQPAGFGQPAPPPPAVAAPTPPPTPAGPAPGGAFPPAEEPWVADGGVDGGEQYDEPAYQADPAQHQADQAVGGGEYGGPAYRDDGAGYPSEAGYGAEAENEAQADYRAEAEYGAQAHNPADAEYGAQADHRAQAEYRAEDEASYGPAGVVPGFEVEDGAGRPGDRGWAAYPSADNPEPVRTPSEISARVEQAEPNWNRSDNWPEPARAPADRRLPGGDRRTSADRRADGRATADRRTNAERLPHADRRTAGVEDDAVGTVRLPRVLIVGAGIIVLGLIVNLIVTFLADGPGGELRWLVPPGIALVVSMVLALLDAAAPKDHRPGRLDVSILIAIAVVLVGIGVGGFALTAGTEYVGGYLTGNESGEDRLVKPVAKPSGEVTVTVENVTYTSHFTRVEVMLANGAKEPVTIPIAGSTFTAADGTALHADTRRSNWPSKVATGGTARGTITFKGKLPDSADAAVLTLKSGETAFAIPVALSN